MKIIDDTGRELDLPDQPCRVVSLLPAVTETLLMLGAERQVVGVAGEPADGASDRPSVGTVRRVSLTAVQELSPDLVIGSPTANVQDQLAEIEAIGITVYRACPKTVFESILSLLDFARVLGVSDRGQRLALNLLAEINRVRNRVRGASRPRAALAVWGNPLMLAGSATLLGDLLRQAGAVNVAPPRGDPFPAVTASALSLLDPDVIVLARRFFPFTSAYRQQLEREAPCTATYTGRVLIFDGDLTLVPTARIARAVHELAEILHNTHTEAAARA